MDVRRMNYYRSFPRDIPPNRNYVVDDVPRLTVSELDLRSAAEPLPTDSFTLLEWDIVVSKEDRDIWEFDCRKYPGSLIVAPYRLYPISTGHKMPRWAHHNLVDRNDYTKGMEPIGANVANTDWVSFGMIYFPYRVFSAFLATGRPFTDTEFSRWYWDSYRTPTWVNWDVRPIHLHY